MKSLSMDNLDSKNKKNIRKLLLIRPPPKNPKDNYYLNKFNKNGKKKKKGKNFCDIF